MMQNNSLELRMYRRRQTWKALSNTMAHADSCQRLAFKNVTGHYDNAWMLKSIRYTRAAERLMRFYLTQFDS